ncbi:hypothetical protein ACLQ20_23725 [Micromonospora sp. DT46]|uniref:hypothetical protein n=1 Tax=Micromonospora sp. DT46 TaxID=3393435 RepID=UPI003CF488F0
MLWLLFGFMMIMFSLNPANDWGELVAVASFFGVICYLVSLASMFSLVKPQRKALLVINPGAVVTVPWSRIRSIDAQNGLVVQVVGAKEVVCHAFQGSLVGRIFGAASANRAADTIERYRTRSASLEASDEVESRVPWRRHLLWLTSIWSVLAIGVPLGVRLL